MNRPGVLSMSPIEVRHRLQRSWAPAFRDATQHSARLEAESLIAFRLTDARRLGSLQLVEEMETGWLGLACAVAP